MGSVYHAVAGLLWPILQLFLKPIATNMATEVDMTINDIHSEVTRLDPNLSPHDDAYKAAVVMLLAVQDGANMRKLKAATGYPMSFIRRIGANLRANRVWVGSKTACDWFGEDGAVSLWCDVNVALGFMRRA